MVIRPDFPDPSDYLQFGPGNLVGLRAGWSAAEAPAIVALTKKASATTGVSARQAIFEQYQEALNQSGPFIPLLRPAAVVVGTKGIKNLQSNGLWLVDLRNLG